MLSVAVMAFVVVIIGGLGSLWGSVVAGLLLGLVSGLVEAYIASGMTEMVSAALLLLTLWFRPEGIAGKKVAVP
jgi:branched-chain amino acid transport system permease protein